MSRKNVANNKSNNKMLPSDILRLEKQVLNEIRRNNQPRQQRQGKKTVNRQFKESFNNPSSVASAYSTGVSTTRPSIVMKGLKGGNMVLVRHREFNGNVSGVNSAAFTQAFALALNPGIAATFPWLSVMAANWQSYRFRKLKFDYYTRTGSNVPGSVILCPDYDAADAAPVSEQVIDSYEDAKEDAPWKNICCVLNPVAMHLMGPKKFIRLGNAPPATDIKTYDVGNMFVYTVDSSAAASWGKLWVEYEVELYVPQLPPGGSSFTQTALVQNGTAMTGAEPLGQNPIVSGNMQLVAGNNGTNSLLTISNAIVGGEYSLNLTVAGTVIASGFTVTAVGSNLKSGLFNNFPAAATSAAFLGTYTSTASTMTFAISITATTITGCEICLALAPTAAY